MLCCQPFQSQRKARFHNLLLEGDISLLEVPHRFNASVILSVNVSEITMKGGKCTYVCFFLFELKR